MLIEKVGVSSTNSRNSSTHRQPVYVHMYISKEENELELYYRVYYCAVHRDALFCEGLSSLHADLFGQSLKPFLLAIIRN